MAAAKKSEDNQYYRYSKRIKEVEQLLPRGFRPRKLIDVGCAEGTITAPLGAHFGLPKDQFFGCDIRDVPTKDGMTFQLFDGVNLTKHETGSCCLVTMLMALHHVQKPRELLSEVVRVLRPGIWFHVSNTRMVHSVSSMNTGLPASDLEMLERHQLWKKKKVSLSNPATSARVPRHFVFCGQPRASPR